MDAYIIANAITGLMFVAAGLSIIPITERVPSIFKF